MKIKDDFVTNSSSCAIVVYIPSSFEPELDQIIKTCSYSEFIEMDKPSDDQILEVINEVKSLLGALKNGSEINVRPYGWETGIIFEIIRENNFDLLHVDVDGDGATTIHGITRNKLREMTEKAERLEIETKI